MSDYTVEERLDGCYRGLLWLTIFNCVGMVGCYLALGIGGSDVSFFWVFLVGVAWGFPVLKKVLFSGIGSAFFGPLKADYEVVTVDGAGNRISGDGGAQSIQGNFVGRLFLLAAIFIICPVVVTLQVWYLSIKGFILNIRANPKPVFLKSIFFLIILNIAAYIVPFGLMIAGAAVSEAARLTTSGDFTYSLNESKNGAIIEKYKGKGGNVVIPSQLNGKPVVMIASETFQKSTITSLTISEGIKDIGGRAFRGSENLTSVTLPRSLERIAESAFENCTSLVDVTIPSGKNIAYGKTVTFLTSDQNGIKLGERLYFLDEQGDYYGAFEGCTKLSSASRQAIEDTGYTGKFQKM